jgi:hypothetical protein
MDLEVARKSLSKRSVFSSKRIAFFAVAGLVLVGGILLRAGQYYGQPEAEENAPATVAAPPPSAVTPAAETAEPAAETAPPEQEAGSVPNQQPSAAVEENAPVTDAAPPPSAATPTVETTEPAAETAPPAQGADVAPSEQAEQSGTEPPELPDSGMILVSRKPVEVLASPSASAPTMYGFPAGRPFRVIGREGDFAKILDLKSGATGWIDAAALAPPPPVPAVSTPSQPRPAAVGQKPTRSSGSPTPKAAKKDSQVSSGSEAATEPGSVQTRRRPGVLFGQGGIFGGIFGNSN